MCDVQDKFDELLGGRPPLTVSDLTHVMRVDPDFASAYELALTALYWHDRARQLAIKLAAPDRCD